MVAADLVTALMLLTRLPVARFALPHDPARLARCAWAFPVIGLLVGGLGSIVYAAASWLGLPPLLGATWTIAAMMLLTGALHEDGLADTMDGFGGGATAVRKLEIMRDSRIGSYGALALLVCLAVRITALASLADSRAVTKGLVLAGTLGRSGMLLPVLMLRPARGDGLASSLNGRAALPSGVAFAIAAAACLLCLTLPQAVVVVAVTAVICVAWVNFARSQVSGYTGDVLGACEMIVECVILTSMVPLLK